MALNAYVSIITLNLNGLNVPIKRHRVAEWIRKQNPFICCLQKTHPRLKDTHRLKVKGWKKIISCKWNGKIAGVAVLRSDKIDFKAKTIVRDKEGHCIMIKGTSNKRR